MKQVTNHIPLTLDYFMRERENQYFDRKSARKNPREITKHLIAFANADGGYLVIGVEDDGTLTGFRSPGSFAVEDYALVAEELLREMPTHVSWSTVPMMNVNGEADVVLVIAVEPVKNRIVADEDGAVYLRQDHQSMTLSPYEVQILQYDKGERYFEDEIVNGSGFADLDEHLVSMYMRSCGRAGEEPREYLRAKGFLRSEELTVAGLLLFGTEPQAFLPYAAIEIKRFAGTEIQTGEASNLVETVVLDGALPEQMRRMEREFPGILEQRIRLDENGHVQAEPEYPQTLWKEGVFNALIHRNYAMDDVISLWLFEDRMEIYSPGMMPNLVLLEDIAARRYSRNPRIARGMLEFDRRRGLDGGLFSLRDDMQEKLLENPQVRQKDHYVLFVLEKNA